MTTYVFKRFFTCHTASSSFITHSFHPANRHQRNTFHVQWFFVHTRVTYMCCVLLNLDKLSIFPHILVWGSCCWLCTSAWPRLSTARRLLTHSVHIQLTHTRNLLTHNLSPHNLLTRNNLVTTQLTHTQLAHAQLAHTQIVTTQLTHTQLVTPQLTHTQFAHTQLVTTQLAHTQLPHAQLVTPQLTHTQLDLTFTLHGSVTLQLTHTQFAHTCSEMSYRIVDVECIGRAKTLTINRHEEWKVTIYIYMYNHSRHWTYKTAAIRYYKCPPSCDLNAPRGGTIYMYILQVQVHASMNPSTTSSVASLGNIGRWAVAPLQIRSFTSIQMVHTHAPQQRGWWDDDEIAVKVKMRWKLLNQDAKRGTQEKRERANTNTTHLARNGQNPGKAGEKKKSGGPTDTDQDQRRRGRTEAPEPT